MISNDIHTDIHEMSEVSLFVSVASNKQLPRRHYVDVCVYFSIMMMLRFAIG